MAKFQGTLQELGMSIFMQGSHQLLDDKGELVALLIAAKESLDLNEFVGEKVEVSGDSAPSVEGVATMVTVDSVKKI